jgi:hypothetical protein
MKNLILDRIACLKSKYEDFNPGTMRWRSLYLDKVHISKINFSELSDEDLVSAYETIIRYCSKIM